MAANTSNPPTTLSKKINEEKIKRYDQKKFFHQSGLIKKTVPGLIFQGRGYSKLVTQKKK